VSDLPVLGWCRWSAGDPLLVDEAAEDGFAVDTVVGQVNGGWQSGFGLGWGQLSDAAVRSGRVVVLQVAGEGSA
jgi:hypothetical protein